MHAEGNLKKMKTQMQNGLIQYSLILDNEIKMNDLIGHTIKLSFGGRINCVSCGNITKKAFGQGFCYKCFISSPMNSECIIRPELCQAHIGKGRDAEWEEKNHNQPHVVYLALTKGVKVGVTRADQIPTRWIDQGAWKAIVLAEVPYRQIAGEIEVALKEHMADKTNWRDMLKNIVSPEIDLEEEKEEALELLPEPLQEFFSDNDDVWELNYPVEKYPVKVKSIGFDKMPVVEGKLFGIKGQYLIFEDERVLNVRNHSGYFIQLEA
ncbi:MAG: DUF2797 domain-containing protein [Bacteroidetes bacterium]|nr:DUF2797 domain-containing protein [Bacteroidota bacterium]